MTGVVSANFHEEAVLLGYYVFIPNVDEFVDMRKHISDFCLDYSQFKLIKVNINLIITS